MEYLMTELNSFIALGKTFKITDVQASSEAETNGKYLNINGKQVIDFTRLDYLALGAEPQIKSFMKEDIANQDISCPASQMILKPDSIEKLELAIAGWHRLEHSLIFSNGYSANINVMQALGLRLKTPHLTAYARSTGFGKETAHIPTVFIIDKDSHYSLIHGVRTACKFSGTCFSFSYTNTHPDSLKQSLGNVQKKFGKQAIKIIVTDSLVSSTGQYVNIKYLYDMAVHYDCLLYVDEAHAVGAVGEQGAGVFSEQLSGDFEKERIMIMGTFTKSFSQLGGYVSFGSPELMALVRASSPQYIFSAPLLPWMAQTLNRTLALLAGNWGAQRRTLLHKRSSYLRLLLKREGFDILNSTSHIIPVLIGDEEKCLEIADALLDYGYNLASFRFPAVPKGKAILRISMCADITNEEIEGLVNALINCYEHEAVNG